MGTEIEKYFDNPDVKDVKDLLVEIKEPEKLKYFSFIMFKPDAFYKGKVGDIIKDLEENGIYVVKIKKVMSNPKIIEKFYEPNKKKYPDSFWLTIKSLRDTILVPAIVIGDPENFPHLSKKIRNLIGPTTVIVGEKHHLRYKHGGPSRIFNLIHASDDPAYAFREALIFYNVEDINEVIDKINKFLKEGKIERDEKEIERVIRDSLENKLDYDLSEEFILLKIKKKILKRLVFALDEQKQVYKGLLEDKWPVIKELKELLEGESKIFEEVKDLRLRRKSLLEFWKEEYNKIEELNEILRKETEDIIKYKKGMITPELMTPLKIQNDLINNFRILIDEEKYLDAEIEDLILDLAAHGINLDEWEEVFLISRRIHLNKTLKDLKEKFGDEFILKI